MRWVFLIVLALASASAFTAPAPIARPLTRSKCSREVLSKFLASPSKRWLDLVAGIQQLYPLARAAGENVHLLKAACTMRGVHASMRPTLEPSAAHPDLFLAAHRICPQVKRKIGHDLAAVPPPHDEMTNV
ncbi:hypothetical protein T492DRAFT_885050 [Pavlovales sp. CCMP2436]|nr:hypothetical protein T492DRAFT_885050 [Pavlovales sp. CCMP2436]